ncbi:uncharacterized protein LOC129591960 [Paramacrobiotus metropolitanus]|uniref:uncharacterized protein LOC129591960 n=1 Tax=Paramacrobiotus metropolitanus TaxID=2943436 RepID=UPI002445B4DD|nr:uncharacterized protein LOC129591960 [Paramacrobiotus metropolitanus]
MMEDRWKFYGFQIIFYVLFLLVPSGNARYQNRYNQNVCAVGSPGYKADILSGCETYFYCHADASRETFACPFGMLFDERRGQCDTWNSVTCPMPVALLQESMSLSSSATNLANPPPPYSGYAGYTLQPSLPAPYHVGSHQNNHLSANNLPATATAPPTNPMDFLAALLFPPLAGQQDLTDFVNTAPSGVRQSFLRVAGEGHLPAAQINLQPGAPPMPGQQSYTPYVEPLAGAGHRPVFNDAPPGGGPASLGEGMSRGRESPGITNNQAHRRSKPSPGVSQLDPGMAGMMPPGGHLQGGPPMMSYDTGPVPPHLLGGHAYMFGQLSMHNQTTAIGGAIGQGAAPLAGHQLPMSINGAGLPLSGPNAQVEALKPIMRSLMQNPYQPHLRRMASLLASGTPLDPLGALSSKFLNDPMGAAAVADPGVAAGGKGKKPGKALDDGLVDARR